MKALCALISFVIGLMAGPALAASDTHCKSSEIDFFSCAIAGSNKVVSLCGNRDEGTNEISWLQYRFGLIGHPEMIYPTAKHGSLDKFYGGRVYSRGSAYLQYDVWFHIGVYNYSVSAYSTGDESEEIRVYVFHEKKYRSASGKLIDIQGTLNCSQPSEKLMSRLGDLLPSLQPEPEIEN